MKEIPDGIYICKINKIERKESKTGKEIVVIEFQITDETNQYYNEKIYMTQFINTPFGFHLLKDFFESLQTTLVFEDLKFGETERLDSLIDGIMGHTKLMEFDIKQEAKGIFKTFTVEGIYDLIKV